MLLRGLGRHSNHLPKCFQCLDVFPTLLLFGVSILIQEALAGSTPLKKLELSLHSADFF